MAGLAADFATMLVEPCPLMRSLAVTGLTALGHGPSVIGRDSLDSMMFTGWVTALTGETDPRGGKVDVIVDPGGALAGAAGQSAVPAMAGGTVARLRPANVSGQQEIIVVLSAPVAASGVVADKAVDAFHVIFPDTGGILTDMAPETVARVA